MNWKKKTIPKKIISDLISTESNRDVQDEKKKKNGGSLCWSCESSENYNERIWTAIRQNYYVQNGINSKPNSGNTMVEKENDEPMHWKTFVSAELSEAISNKVDFNICINDQMREENKVCIRYFLQRHFFLLIRVKTERCCVFHIYTHTHLATLLEKCPRNEALAQWW